MNKPKKQAQLSEKNRKGLYFNPIFFSLLRIKPDDYNRSSIKESIIEI